VRSVPAHRAADAAFVDARLGALINFDALDDFGCQQRVIERPARGIENEPVGRRHRLAVEQGAIERRVGTTNADALALAELTIDVDAGHVRQGFRRVLVREFTHVLGGDGIHDGAGLALDLHRLTQAASDARNNDLFHLGTGRRLRLRDGRLLEQRQSDRSADQRASLAHTLAPYPLVVF
jgi:hypothetical protein